MGKKRETKPLLDKSGTSGSVPKKNPPPAAPKAKPGGGTSAGSTLSKPTLASVHEQASLESPSADPAAVAAATAAAEAAAAPPPSASSFFGVRNYLHNFYDPIPTNITSTTTAGGGGKSETYQYLIRPKYYTSGTSGGDGTTENPHGCAVMFFKIGLCIGATLFLLGTMTIIIGYAIPRQLEFRGQTAEYKIIDRNAIAYNRNLDLCKIIGLVAFRIGGIVLVAALLTPTFANSYWDENITTEPFRLALAEDQELSDSDDDDEQQQQQGPKSPGIDQVPVTEKIRCIQPLLTEEYEK